MKKQKLSSFFKEHNLIILSGLLIGIVAAVLTKMGNPPNMGFCIACFIRDISGALNLHSAAPVQYLRPEIPGFILGAFVIALTNKEFKSTGGSSPLLRLVMGAIMGICALVFLGCPLRMLLRLASGELAALFGFIGFSLGVYIGSLFIKSGFDLGEGNSQNILNGIFMALLQIPLLVLLFTASPLLAFSQKGPGSMHAPIWLSLTLALILGALLQRSRLCQSGGIRNIYLIKNFHLFYGSVAIFLAALLMNIAFNHFHFSSYGPIAHGDQLWNLLSMMALGMAAVLLGGCPMRQLILTGTGNIDAGLSVIGMTLGSAFAHNFGMASIPNAVDDAGNITGGPTVNGKIAVVFSILILFCVAYFNSQKRPTTSED